MRSLFDLPAPAPALPSSPLLADVCEAKHLGNAESQVAFASVQPSTGKTRQDILAWLKRVRRGSPKEYAVAANRPLNTISGRWSELKRDGLIRPANTKHDGSMQYELNGDVT